MAEFDAWKQTDHRTCGGASMMVALRALKGDDLSAEREREIWKFANNGSAALPGAFPGRLAIYARSQGCSVAVFEDREKLETILTLSTEQDRFPAINPAQALQEHDYYLRAAEEEGISVYRKPLSLEEIAAMASKGPVLMMVSTASDVSGLHWVVLQHYDPETGLCTLMDPGVGQNFTGPLALFTFHYGSVHPFLGIAVVLS